MSDPRDPVRQFLASLPPSFWVKAVLAVAVLAVLAVFGAFFVAGGIVLLAGYALVSRLIGAVTGQAPLGRTTAPPPPGVIEGRYVVIETSERDEGGKSA